LPALCLFISVLCEFLTYIDMTELCPFCGKKYASPSHLTLHVKRVHLKLKNFGCNYCEKKFSCNYDVTRHQNTVHLKQKPNVCSCCYKSFASRQELQVHFSRIHPDFNLSGERKVWDCICCSEKFNAEFFFLSHLRECHSGFKVNCPKCDLVFDNQYLMSDHYDTVHCYSCKLCSSKKLYDEESGLIDHQDFHHHRVFKYVCSICAQPKTTQENLNAHLKNVHFYPGFYCDKCHKDYYSKYNLKRHFQTMHYENA